jgi:hypothetical protein
MAKKSKGITNNLGISSDVVADDRLNYSLDNMEGRSGDEELGFTTYPESKERYYPINKRTIGVIEIQQQINSSSPWFLALQKAIGDLTLKVAELQDRAHIEPVQPIKIYNTTIYDLDNSEYDLAIPIQVVIEEYLDETVARIPELNIFTSSDTDTEAILLLKQEITDLYEELNHCNNLGSLPQSWLNTLKKLLRKHN